MNVLPFSVPKLGLTIDSRAVGLARIARARSLCRGMALQSYDTREVPSGAVVVSHADPNIKDAAVVVSQVRSLVGARAAGVGPSAVSLTVHGLCARIALFEFERFPEKHPEREAIVSWRFQKDFQAPIANARLAYRVFATPAENGKQSVRVLAGLIQLPIIEQYESVCEEAGLIPTSLGLSFFRIFDLCRLMIAGHAANAEEVFFVYFEDDSFSFFALHRSVPVFVRVKNLRETPEGPGQSGAAAVANEVRATLQFYDDRIRRQPWRGGEAARPVFVFNGSVALGEPFGGPAAILEIGTAASLGIHEISLAPEGILRSRLISAHAPVSGKGLIALSGVLAA